jgi:hypothetical protein
MTLKKINEACMADLMPKFMPLYDAAGKAEAEKQQAAEALQQPPRTMHPTGETVVDAEFTEVKKPDEESK